MASQSVPKPFQKILDPTKIGTWNIVRRPPVENHSIIQGKQREQNSNAFKTHQLKEGVRLRKALNAITHGKNIFVYHNIRTNQVVYSLTRYLEKNSVLRQLVYHGKKTVPATLRKDMWVPYYSVHFNDTKIGLRAYHLLREFALQRQLAPPREMITITERFLDQKRPRAPEEAKKFDEKYADKIGWLMEKKDRARAVMDQKATSIADVSAVLAIQEEEIKNGFADGKRGYLTRTARRRRREARAKETAKATEQTERVEDFEKALSSKDVEYKIQEPEASNGIQGNGVKILWTDIHDARYAEAWPERVRHGELDLTRQHVIPGQKVAYGVEVLADEPFNEKKPEQEA
ncbi:transcriptional regulation of mitochondrial recombination-domain-containing protein [Aspergillus avenaceus]|uniref:Large ribosomal subunit protein mL67 n=1 Tax=Aspergillus avenaceus TaxID=36643 RepID=A0A5N6U8L1_ASPAV|nr:transcriptional regulation of mitochondrial recombination-domain-containing protein [Aspergillus avenaceus]